LTLAWVASAFSGEWDPDLTEIDRKLATSCAPRPAWLASLTGITMLPSSSQSRAAANRPNSLFVNYRMHSNRSHRVLTDNFSPWLLCLSDCRGMLRFRRFPGFPLLLV